MAIRELTRGATYKVKKSDGKWVLATFISHYENKPLGNFSSGAHHTTHRWTFQSHQSGRDISVRSLQKVRTEGNAPV